MNFPVINFKQFIAICIIYIIIMGLIVWNNAAAWGSSGGFFGSIATTIQLSWWFFGLMSVWFIVGVMLIPREMRVNIMDLGKELPKTGSFVHYTPKSMIDNDQW